MITRELYSILGDIFKMNTNTNTPRVLNMPIKKKMPINTMQILESKNSIFMFKAKIIMTCICPCQMHPTKRNNQQRCQ